MRVAGDIAAPAADGMTAAPELTEALCTGLGGLTARCAQTTRPCR